MNSRRRLALLLLACALPATAARNPPATIADVASSNGLSVNGWLQVRTPSILRVEIGALVPGDARAAIAQYDLLAALPPAAVDPATRAEALRRASDLRVQIADADASSEQGFHVSEVRRAVADYGRVLAEYPDDPHADRVRYQLARAHQLLGESDASISALMDLGRLHPQSARAPDAHFRAGEQLFARARYAEAEAAYARLLALGPGLRTGAPYQELAQYKYGWALYKQSQFARAATVFVAILDRDLPPGVLEEPAPALAAVARERAERASESLRVAALSFAALGGGSALNQHFAQAPGSARLETLMHAALVQSLLDKERYTEAAESALAFAQAHPQHARAPQFHQRAIAAYEQGGFGEPALRARESFASAYAPTAPFWSARTPDAAVLALVLDTQDLLARHYQAAAQQSSDTAARRAGYLRAADWYTRRLEQFPQDVQHARTSLLLADALLEAGELGRAAQQYAHTAYALPAHEGAPVAALAAVQTWQRQVRENGGAVQTQAQRESVAAALQLAERFPAHPQRSAVLMSAAEDQYALGDLEAARTTAARVLEAPASPALQRGALGVVADVHFAQKDYAQAEAAYTRMLQLPATSEGARRIAVEQLAASVYRQAESARSSGDLRAAAAHFERVARLAPEASIRASADYDAASAHVSLEDWARAAPALEAFHARFADHRLMPDADKKLALAYEKNAQPALAAATLTRISQRQSEAPDTRRTAAWTAAQLYDQAQLAPQAARAYLDYVQVWPQPLDAAQQARLRLSQLAAPRDIAGQRHWLEQIVLAEGGAPRSEGSRRLAAEASLTLGRLDAEAARQLALRAPLEQSLPRRRAATESAVRALERAAAAGYADLTSSATFWLATVYADFGSALLRSERPAALSGEALAQYDLLLEEQAFPFEEKAIGAHEINLARLRQGTWNEHIGRSVNALGQLSPARYGKQEQREASYEVLH